MKKLALILGLVFVAGTSYAMVYMGGGGEISNELNIESFQPIKEVENIIPAGNLSANSAIGLLESLANDIAKELKNTLNETNKGTKGSKKMIALLNNAAAIIGEAENPAVKVGFNLLKDGKLGIHLQAYEVGKNLINTKTKPKQIVDLGIALKLEPQLAKKIVNLLKQAVKNTGKVTSDNAINKTVPEEIARKVREIVPPSKIAEEIVNTLTLNLDQLSVRKVEDLFKLDIYREL
jgi:hypothetical protein